MLLVLENTIKITNMKSTNIKFTLYVLILILILFFNIKAQDIEILLTHQLYDRCYSINGLMPGQTYDLTSAILGIKIREHSDIIIYDNKKFLYNYRGIIWRIEYLNVRFDCPYINDIYLDGDIKVYQSDRYTAVTDTQIYRRMLEGK